MYGTKNLVINHVMKAAGLRAKIGYYSINGHLSGKRTKGPDSKNYLLVLFVGGIWMIWWNYKMAYHDRVLSTNVWR